MGRGAVHLKQTPEGANLRAGSARRLRVRADFAWILQPILVWNHTESVPIGRYSVEYKTPVRGDIVAIAPTSALQVILDGSGVLPAGCRLLEERAAASGESVCRHGVSITINGEAAATPGARTDDGCARPQWTGYRTLGADQIVGVAHPLVTVTAPGRSSGETQ